MLSNSLPDADLNLPEMKTTSPPSGGVTSMGLTNQNFIYLPGKRVPRKELQLTILSIYYIQISGQAMIHLPSQNFHLSWATWQQICRALRAKKIISEFIRDLVHVNRIILKRHQSLKAETDGYLIGRFSF